MILGESARRWFTEASRSRTAEIRHLTALMDQMAPAAADTIEQVPDDSDLLISGPLTYDGAVAVAQHRGIPHILATFLPVTPSRDGRSSVFSAFPDRISRANALAGTVAASVAYRVYAGVGREIRERLGLPRNTVRQYWRTARSTPGLLAAGPTLVPPAADWGPHLRQTGQWYLPGPLDWQPPADLAAFLDAGDPPVYIGFGSMASADASSTAEAIIDGIRRAGVRAVFGAGWSDVDLTRSGTLSDDVFSVGEIPHDRFFPLVSAVIHHGGAGTTATVARAGVPQWIVPHIGDQPYWGTRISQLGVGPAPVPPNQIDRSTVATALRQLTADPLTRERAATVGAAVAAEPGVDEAVALITEYLGG